MKGIFKYTDSVESSNINAISNGYLSNSLRNEILSDCEVFDKGLESLGELIDFHTQCSSKKINSIQDAKDGCEEIKNTVANITGKLNLSNKDLTMDNYGLESIHNPIDAYNHGVEFVGNLIKKITDKLKDFFKWLWKKIKQFFNWLTGNESDEDFKKRMDNCMAFLKDKDFAKIILSPTNYKKIEENVEIANKVNFIVEFETRDFTDKDFVIKEIAQTVKEYTNFIREVGSVSFDNDPSHRLIYIKKTDEDIAEENDTSADLISKLPKNIREQLNDRCFRKKLEIMHKIKSSFGSKNLTLEKLGFKLKTYGDEESIVLGGTRGSLAIVSSNSFPFGDPKLRTGGSSYFINIGAYDISAFFSLENENLLNERFGKAVSGLDENTLEKIMSNTYLNRIKANLSEVESSGDKFLKAVEDAEKLYSKYKNEGDALGLDRSKLIALISKEVMSMSSFTFKYSMSFTKKEAIDILTKLASTDEIKEKVNEAFANSEKRDERIKQIMENYKEKDDE